MKIATNPINLRAANYSESKLAAQFGHHGITLVSETAFHGKTSIYIGIENDSGEVESAGWIAAI